MHPQADRVFCAVDTADEPVAADLAGRLAEVVGGVKLGLEFFLANGPAAVARVAAGRRLFLDLKLHDIPNTVAAGVRSVAPLQPFCLTLHASGGEAMLKAAAAAAKQAAADGGSPRMRLLGVTVLTSLGEPDLARLGQVGPIADQVRRLAELSRECGLDGVVCSPHEVADLRARCGPDFLLVTPGVRPTWAATDDQQRVMSPAEAVAAGADYLVIGRPITRNPDPAAAAARIVRELAAA